MTSTARYFVPKTFHESLRPVGSAEDIEWTFGLRETITVDYTLKTIQLNAVTLQMPPNWSHDKIRDGLLIPEKNDTTVADKLAAIELAAQRAVDALYKNPDVARRAYTLMHQTIGQLDNP